jgi:hypothetical protein
MDERDRKEFDDIKKRLDALEMLVFAKEINPVNNGHPDGDYSYLCDNEYCRCHQ